MPEYRRWRQDGGKYFFTLVTCGRAPILAEPLARACLRSALTDVRRQRPFQVNAFCLLPDHLHCVFTLPEGDADFSGRWLAVKALFTRRYLEGGGAETPRTDSRQRTGERGVWQRRFWEHLIRDDLDLERHVDYVHFNPVKHGLAASASDWPWSTFHRYVRNGMYDASWGCAEPRSVAGMQTAGEA